MKPTLVRWDEIEWRQIPKHPGLFNKEVLSKEEWAARSLRVWKMLVDKIEPGGAVLPHFHDVAEIIHFLEEEVSVLLGEQRAICHPGDTIIVPAGVVHSVANKGGRDSRQISIFLPHTGNEDEDFGRTELVEGIEI